MCPDTEVEKKNTAVVGREALRRLSCKLKDTTNTQFIMRTESRREADVIEIGRRVTDRLLSLRMTREEAARTVKAWADRFWLVYSGPTDSPDYTEAMASFCDEMLKSAEPLAKGTAYTVTLTIPVRVCVPSDPGLPTEAAEDGAIDAAVAMMRGNPNRYLCDSYVSDVEMDRHMRFGDVVGDEHFHDMLFI